eukprot:TRINITY_DN22949_c0_g1_i1.p1 TRINITY_DN22949_c0_g1~~TRINITY_DN22949_c0_g1_i1.p1  ORF type:complete len:246 (+),score=60.88 TRINITY_DN22949_c0_g1_i1:133-870(+)
MAGRTLSQLSSRGLRRALSSSRPAFVLISHLQHAALDVARSSDGCHGTPALPSARQPLFSYQFGLERGFATNSDVSAPPPVEDPAISRAVNYLLANEWLEIEEDVRSEVESVLAQATDDKDGKAALENAWSAAQAVEKFAEKLEFQRQALDELSGGKFGGESVGTIPDVLKESLRTSLERYTKYLGAFSADEEWLKKKVELELGASLLTVKQRCSGLEPEWGMVSLLGTSGLSGSYVEKRSGWAS